MKKLLSSVVSFFILLSLVPSASGKNFNEMMRIEEQKRIKLQAIEQKILEAEKRFVLDYGGWIDIRFDNYNEDDNDSSLTDTLDATTSFDQRFWMKLTLKPEVGAAHQNQHSVYLRFKNIATITAPEDVNQTYDNAGPHLDQGYMVLDMRPWWMEGGRRYFSVGQGIAYGNVHDGVEFYANYTDWNLKAFYSHTLPNEDNIDLSVPGASKRSDRSFYGFEGRYLGLPGGHSVYGFYLSQKDSSDEDPIDNAQNYTYESDYIGFGLQGKVVSRAHYWVEIIRENGKSLIFSTGEERNINAWAGDFGVTYDMDIYSQPNFTMEYAFGSGDADRGNVTDTSNGNADGQDTNFLYFGYLPTGFALAPRLSNVHMYKVAVLFKPLEKIDLLKNITLGIDYFRFYKDENAGGISDADATVGANYIGSEIDVNVSWQVLSDVSLTFEYGHFMTGDAFLNANDDNEDYYSVDMTLTF